MAIILPNQYIIETQADTKDCTFHDSTFFKCGQCGEVKPAKGKVGPAYGMKERDNPQQKPICFDCCGVNDKADMVNSGKATLYLTETKEGNNTKRTVTNWPDSLTFPVIHYWAGRHNIARIRHNVNFVGPDGFVWYGVTYGNETQICHCKRTKEEWKHNSGKKSA